MQIVKVNKIFGTGWLVLIIFMLFTLSLFVSEASARVSLVSEEKSESSASAELFNAAAHLAAERGIELSEAKERVQWQDRAEELDAELKENFSEDYGGMWIDGTTDRVQVGVLNDTEIGRGGRVNLEGRVLREGLSGAVDYIPVEYSLKKLRSVKDEISASFVDRFESGAWPAQFGIKTSENKVEVGFAKDISRANIEYSDFFSNLDKKYPDMISYNRIEGKITQESECNWWFCDSPLRGGVGLKGSASGYSGQKCTAGFNVVGSSGARYIVTAGHCAPYGSGWATETKNYTLKKIGPIKSGNGNLLDNHGTSKLDAMLIQIREDTYNWSVIGMINVRAGTNGVNGVNPPSSNERYDITTSGANTTSLEGSRVCISGAKSADLNYHEGGSCGKVKSVDNDITACDTFDNCNHVYKVTRASYCSRGGDSGAPVFRLGKAHGIHIASGPSETSQHPNPVCHESKYYTGMNPIINAFDGNISVF